MEDTPPPLVLLGPSSSWEDLAAHALDPDELTQERHRALVRYQWLIDEGSEPELVRRWGEQRLWPLGLGCYEQVVARARGADWWPAAYETWRAAAVDHTRRRLVGLEAALRALARAPGDPFRREAVQTWRAMLQDLGVAHPDITLALAKTMGWWRAWWRAYENFTHPIHGPV